MNPNHQMSERLLIVQPYIPAYRVPFFRTLSLDLLRCGVSLAVATATATGVDRERCDDYSSSVSDFLMREKNFRLGRGTMKWRDLSSALDSFCPTLIVVEQAIKNLETWQLLLNGNHHSARVAMWGHGRSFTTQQSWIAQVVKREFTKRADWFFAYTEEGAAYVESVGFSPARVTVLFNATDTTTLREELGNVTPDAVREFSALHGLVHGKTGLFLGGIDDRKGIRFLLQAAWEIAKIIPGFRLLIGGAGSLVHEVESEMHKGAPINYLGRIDGPRRALAMASADVLLIPEWVGLVAVDSLAAGLPLITTTHPSHAPEFAYLKNGETALVVEHDVQSYANAVALLLKDNDRRQQMRKRAFAAGSQLTIEAMSDRFCRGIVEWSERGK